MVRTPYRDIPGELKNRNSFEGNSMSAVFTDNPYGYHPRYGRLDHEEQVKLRLDEGVGITYVVFSYGTPIAWVRTDGKVYVVEQKFSRITSRHQNLCRAYLTDES
jgi:hypothetical protein